MANFDSEHKAVLDDLLLDLPNVHAGKKLCICLYEQGVGVKLPEGSAARLLEADQNVSPFQPLGRPKMREWIQINLSRSEDYRQYKSVFEESIRHVLGQQEKEE
jgi:hypothetical protein